MADTALRDAERALAAIGDRFVQWREWDEAHARWQAEYIRAGCPGRDPRRDPIRGDEVKGRNGRTARQVAHRWPRPLRKSLLWDPTWRGPRTRPGTLGSSRGPTIDPSSDLYTRLPVGALVLSVEVWQRVGREPSAWRLFVRLGWDEMGVPDEDGVLDCVVGDYPELGDDVPEGAHVEQVTWDWTAGGKNGNTHEQRSTLANWRSWAKGGTVLRVAR